jgi:hypothetical protein
MVLQEILRKKNRKFVFVNKKQSYGFIFVLFFVKEERACACFRR